MCTVIASLLDARAHYYSLLRNTTRLCCVLVIQRAPQVSSKPTHGRRWLATTRRKCISGKIPECVPYSFRGLPHTQRAKATVGSIDLVGGWPSVALLHTSEVEFNLGPTASERFCFNPDGYDRFSRIRLGLSLVLGSGLMPVLG